MKPGRLYWSQDIILLTDEEAAAGIDRWMALPEAEKIEHLTLAKANHHAKKAEESA